VGHVIHINRMRSGYHSKMIIVDHTLTSLESDEIVFSFWIISSFLIVLFIHSFHSCCRSQIDDICVNQLRESLTEIDLCHCICRIRIVINSSNFRNLFTLIWLTKTHQVDHQSLFWRSVELDETVIKWSWISQ
jgi:hypothetical protein